MFTLAASSPPGFPVTWSGEDEPDGSGLASFDILVSVDGSSFTNWLTGTTARGAVFLGEPGRSYAFLSRARGRAFWRNQGGDLVGADLRRGDPMMNRWLSICLVFVSLPARAQSLSDQLAVAGVAEFAAAYQSWDGPRFAAAAEIFHQAGTNDPGSSTIGYWLGVAQFHRMLQLQTLPASPTNKPAADAAREAAIAALTSAVKLDERQAESHALLGTLYGMKIDGNLVRAARFGPKVQKHRQQALATGSDNPRVQYLLGACLFHTAKKPAKQRAALATFLQAEKLFEAEVSKPAGPLEPRWGHATCLTFIGRTYEQLGEPAKAAEYFGKALAAHPADHLAKEGLARVTEAR